MAGELSVRETAARALPTMDAVLSAATARYSPDTLDAALTEHDRQVAARALREAAGLPIRVARSAVITERAECHRRQCSCGHPSEDRLVALISDRWRSALKAEADRINHGGDDE